MNLVMKHYLLETPYFMRLSRHFIIMPWHIKRSSYIKDFPFKRLCCAVFFLDLHSVFVYLRLISQISSQIVVKFGGFTTLVS